MDPKERRFIVDDPAYQVKSLGVLTDDDLHVFIHSQVLDEVLADAAEHVDALRAGAFIGGRYTDGKRRFVEIEGTVLLMESKPTAQPFALEPEHLERLAAGIAERFPGAEDVGLYFTHPRLGLYLSRSETASMRARFDPAWIVTLVTDPVVDKFTFFQFRGPGPVKSGFHIVNRIGPRPARAVPVVTDPTPPRTPPVEARPAQSPLAAPAADPPFGPIFSGAPAEGNVRVRTEPQLTREELFRLATEEVFKDGKVDEVENRTLQELGGLLKLDAETAIRLAKQARRKFRDGELSGGSFDPAALYRNAHKLAIADGELEADEANILAALRSLLKLPAEMVTLHGTPRPALLAAVRPPQAPSRPIAVPQPSAPSRAVAVPQPPAPSRAVAVPQPPAPSRAIAVPQPAPALKPSAQIPAPAPKPPPAAIGPGQLPDLRKKPGERTQASSFTKIPVAELMAAAEPPPVTPFPVLLAEFAGVAFDRQVHALDRLGEHDFSWDLDAGTITLGGTPYRMQVLGTTAGDESWIWAWAQEERPLPPAVVADVNKIHAFGKSRNVVELTTPVLPLASHDPNELSMVASGLTGAHLYYRIPFDGGALFVLVNDPSFGRSDTPAVQRVAQVFPRLLESVRVPARRALVAYMRGCGLEVTEEATKVVGRQGPDSVTATFDAQGALVAIVPTVASGSGVRPRA